jgi:hypothetical protein
MRGVTVELPDTARNKLNELILARDAALDASRSGISRLNQLPPDVDQGLRQRLASENARHAEKHRVLAMLVSRINQFLMEARGVVLEPAPPPDIRLKAGESVSAALTAVRQQIADVRQEIAATRAMPMRRASQLEAVRAYLAGLAQRAQPKIGFDAKGGARVTWVEDMASKDDIVGLLALVLGPQQLAAAFSRELDEQPEPADAVSPLEREKRLAELTQRLFGFEQCEEGLITKAHADGIDVLRRGDASPACVLGVAVKAKTEAAA